MNRRTPNNRRDVCLLKDRRIGEDMSLAENGKQARKKRARERAFHLDRALAFWSFIGLILLTGAEVFGRRYEPQFLTMDRGHLAVAKREAVFDFSVNDQKEKHTLFLLSDEAGRPLLFFADITVNVCIDEVCDPVRIELYWDLLGNYAGFGVVTGFPLLKYDHVPFDPVDYAKLHQVLSDRDSILGERPLTELFDPEASREKTEFTGKEQSVDAVSGATAIEIRGAIVRGALYSCHALWNLAHGDVRSRMRRHLGSIFNADLARRFLHSDSPEYQAYALAEMDAESMEKNLPQVLNLYRQSEPSIRGCILEKLPKKVWRQRGVTRALFLLFDRLDTGTKTSLIENLEYANAGAAAILVDRVESMTKAQLRGYLAYFARDPARLSEPVRAKLRHIAAAEQYAYCYVIDDFLREE
jgi:hypothetical protein